MVALFPLATQRFLERPRGEGGDAKRRGVRTRESNHLLPKTNLFLGTLLLGFVAEQAIDHARIGKRRCIAEAAEFIRRDLAQDPTHDLSRARLGQRFCWMDHVGCL